MKQKKIILTIGGTVLKESDDLVILGVTFNSKMTFEKHQVYRDTLLLGRCFLGFVLSVLAYCSAVWCSAADIHLKQLDCVVSCASFLTWGLLKCNLHIVDLWRYYVCYIRSGVIRCTLFKMLYLCRMCR